MKRNDEHEIPPRPVRRRRRRPAGRCAPRCPASRPWLDRLRLGGTRHRGARRHRRARARPAERQLLLQQLGLSVGVHVGVRHREALGDVEAVRVLVGRIGLRGVRRGQCRGRDAGAAGHHHRGGPERHDHHGPGKPGECGADRCRLAGRLDR
ncbi:hypothetical protein CURTO8I2_170097 [Curtobacterium sp. 8I-2]|nr:hypothetical protein CURTO8I2_170097 [Curtobacterium sp. 8I-2]